MDNNLLRQQVYLAALLHDIGKFYQRADNAGVKNSKHLKEQTKHLESIFCPKGKHGYTHKHVLWTAQFLYDFEPHFKNLLLKADEKETLTFIKLAASHHNPEANNVLSRIIQKADHYSSGIDRTKEKGLVDENYNQSTGSFKQVRMRSIFEGLYNEHEKYEYFLPVDFIQLNEAFFPKKAFENNPDYLSLWESFTGEIKFIQSANFRTFSENLLALLEKYASTIPSSTIHLPDVSLFDHLKTTAAFAVALFDYLIEKNNLEKFEIDESESPFLLIGADVSGIQSFIYEIVSKSAAKNLKGRSFYLQLLVDSILQKITNSLGLFNANIVYSSGGGFYLIAPNTKQTTDKLNTVGDKITEFLYKTHKTSLFVAFEKEPFNEKDLFNQQINITWQSLIEKLDKKKHQKNIKQILNNYNDFFEPIGIGGEQIRDTITGEEIMNNHDVKYLERDKTPPEQPVHKLTMQQIELGKELKQADYWICSDQKLTYWKNSFYNPCDLGIYHYFLTENQVEKQRENLRASADNVRIMAINELNFLETAISGTQNVYGFNFYGGDNFPVIEENGEIFPKTFDLMAGDSETEFKRLGILRMDVDSLGQAFISGFADNKKTFSRYSSLSRNLDYFFKGYLNELWKKEKFKDHTFIIYSGGDDLFIVGKWSLLADMAFEIQTDFKAWTCHNPKINISGGLAVVTPKFPIMKGAIYAADAESKAKNHEIQSLGLKKNAFTIFGEPLNWEHEFPIVKHYKNRLKQQVEEGDLPSGFLHKILNFYENYKDQSKKKKNPRWKWMISYDFARMRQRLKDSETKDFLEELKINIFTGRTKDKAYHSNYEFISLLAISARWAELTIRSKNH